MFVYVHVSICTHEIKKRSSGILKVGIRSSATAVSTLNHLAIPPAPYHNILSSTFWTTKSNGNNFHSLGRLLYLSFPQHKCTPPTSLGFIFGNLWILGGMLSATNSALSLYQRSLCTVCGGWHRDSQLIKVQRTNVCKVLSYKWNACVVYPSTEIWDLWKKRA